MLFFEAFHQVYSPVKNGSWHLAAECPRLFGLLDLTVSGAIQTTTPIYVVHLLVHRVSHFNMGPRLESLASTKFIFSLLRSVNHFDFINRFTEIDLVVYILVNGGVPIDVERFRIFNCFV